MNKAYPGRACMAPLLDVLMTLLHMGAVGWRETLRAREEAYAYLRERLCEVAAEQGAFALLRGSPRVLAHCLRCYQGSAS